MGSSFTVNSYTPSQVMELVSRAGAHKGHMKPLRVFLSAVSAGCLLSFAAASSLVANTSPWVSRFINGYSLFTDVVKLQENAPGVARILGALVFPYGLVFAMTSPGCH